jgi:intraflagellar transport protein 56
VRILFHIAHKKKDGKTLMEYREKLGESIEDQLSLASFHYSQARYQDAIEIYKKLLLEHR